MQKLFVFKKIGKKMRKTCRMLLFLELFMAYSIYVQMRTIGNYQPLSMGYTIFTFTASATWLILHYSPSLVSFYHL